MAREQRRTAKAQLVAAMNQGQSWQKAVASVGLPISRATAYRWQRRVQMEGERPWTIKGTDMSTSCENPRADG